MNQNKVLDVIISLINGVKNSYVLSSVYGEENLSIDNCGYLLGQTLRHYVIPKDHYFVSKKAYDLWTKITNHSIFNYTYRDKITKSTSTVVFVPSSNSPSIALTSNGDGINATTLSNNN